MKQAVLYKKLKGGSVKCLACKWKCTIPEGSTGVCGVRINQKGKLYLSVDGKAVGMGLDPVEKKPLYHFLPGSLALSFGTVGCDFGCQFCQNYHMSQPPREIRKQKLKSEEKLSLLNSLIEQMSENWSPAEIVEYALKLGAQSIAYTYNEPTIFIEYAYKTAKLAHRKGIKNIFVSNGYESEESLEYIAPFLDAINIDLKSFRPDFYRKIVKAKLENVLETIEEVYRRKIHLEITTLIIPTLNDSKKELKSIAEYIYKISPDIPWHVTAFYPSYKIQTLPPTTKEKLFEAYTIGKNTGLHYVYTGNIANNKYSSTFCPKCKGKLIERNGYNIKLLPLMDTAKKRCKRCQTKIGGVWNINN